MTTSAFNDPTAQRLEQIAEGAEPEIVGPRLAEVLHDARWLACNVALIAGGSETSMQAASRGTSTSAGSSSTAATTAKRSARSACSTASLVPSSVPAAPMVASHSLLDQERPGSSCASAMFASPWRRSANAPGSAPS